MNYITSTRVQSAISTQREIDHAILFGYGTAKQFEEAEKLLAEKLERLTPDERAMYDEVIEFYRD